MIAEGFNWEDLPRPQATSDEQADDVRRLQNAFSRECDNWSVEITNHVWSVKIRKYAELRLPPYFFDEFMGRSEEIEQCCEMLRERDFRDTTNEEDFNAWNDLMKYHLPDAIWPTVWLCFRARTWQVHPRYNGRGEPWSDTDLFSGYDV